MPRPGLGAAPCTLAAAVAGDSQLCPRCSLHLKFSRLGTGPAVQFVLQPSKIGSVLSSSAAGRAKYGAPRLLPGSVCLSSGFPRPPRHAAVSPARSPWPQGSCPREGTLAPQNGSQKSLHEGTEPAGTAAPRPQRGPSRCQQPVSWCHLLEAPCAGGTALSQSLVPTTAEGRGTGGGNQQTFPWPAAGQRGGESTAEGGCCQLRPPVGRRFIAARYEPSSEHGSVSWSKAKRQGLKAAWQRLCRDCLLGAGTDPSLPLPGSGSLGKRSCEMLQDLQALGSPPGSPSPSWRSYGSRERLDLLYLCAISLGRYKFLPG